MIATSVSENKYNFIQWWITIVLLKEMSNFEMEKRYV